MPTLMKIRVSDIVGRSAVDFDDGQTVLKQIRPALEAGESVELDFADVAIFASPFFNGSVAILSRDFPSSELNERLRLEHLTEDGNVIARRSIENAKSTQDPDLARKLAVELGEDGA